MGGDLHGRNDGLLRLMLPYDGLRQLTTVYYDLVKKPLQSFLYRYMLF